MRVVRICIAVLFLTCSFGAMAQSAAPARHTLQVSVQDENGVPVADALVILTRSGQVTLRLLTDHAGHCAFAPDPDGLYAVRVEKKSFYSVDVKELQFGDAESLEITLTHQQENREEINVTSSASPIDPAKTSDQTTLDTPEIVNIPYPTSRDIRNLLRFNPNVVQDAVGQLHVAGSQSYETVTLLDGFNISSPVSGLFSMRFSADAVRSIDVETSRYAAEHGHATGGILGFYTGMGDDHFRVSASNFVPSWKKRKGLTFDKWVPRGTVSGPIRKGKMWFYDGLDAEYDNEVFEELPAGADRNSTWRGSNLAKVQTNLTPSNNLTVGVLAGGYYSPYEGLSPRNPRHATLNRQNNSWLAYLKDQHLFQSGLLLETGIAAVRFQDAGSPRGTSTMTVTPEGVSGSFFQSFSGESQRVEGIINVYAPAQQAFGRHYLRFGVDASQIDFEQRYARRPVEFRRADGTLLRSSTFENVPEFQRDNLEVGAYAEDRWSPNDRLLIEPGVRFDWDQIIRRPAVAPRIAFAYLLSKSAQTKFSGGIGLFYGHTQLEYLTRAMVGSRLDTYYAADGTTAVTPPLLTSFTYDQQNLRMPSVVNWSVGIEQKLPASIYLKVNFIEKRGRNGFVYAHANPAEVLSGSYVLTNSRRDHYDAIEFSATRSFHGGYSLFGSYIRSSARTNAVLEYQPTLSLLGRQSGGQLPWSTPNRLISWGWLPVPRSKRFDFVYAAEWHDGFTFTAENVNGEVVGHPSAYRFPDYFAFNPGLEWRFNFRHYRLAMRGVIENATGHRNPRFVNDVMDSPNFLAFSGNSGRALTARIRFLGRN